MLSGNNPISMEEAMIDSIRVVRSTDASPGARPCRHGHLALRSNSSVCHDRGENLKRVTARYAEGWRA